MAYQLIAFFLPYSTITLTPKTPLNSHFTFKTIPGQDGHGRRRKSEPRRVGRND
jgi:hypothetical protein